MSIGLAQAFPEIRTYAGQGTNDPATTVVFDVTPHGFHAQVLSPTDAWFINPAARGDDVVHESFFRSDRGVPQNRFIEPVPAELQFPSAWPQSRSDRPCRRSPHQEQ